MFESVPDVAIIICTYNPDAKIFSRVLDAIKALVFPDNLVVECILVDNNSQSSIHEMPCVKDFLEQSPWAKVIKESQQGLIFARITGVKSTTAPIIVFFDDDNEPAPDYLQAIKNCLDKHHCIAALGPGKVTVEFLEPVSDWFEKNFSKHFQERNTEYTQYGCVPATWTDFYPFGTGLVVKREVFQKYYQAFTEGRLASIGRKGNNLSSGEDIQIVWEAVKMGLAAGISPDLKIKHLIPSQRATLKYIKRLTFGTASSYMPALIGSFPSEKIKALAAIPSKKTIVHNLFKLIRRRVLRFQYKLLLIDLAHYIGDVVGTLRSVEYDERSHFIYKLVEILNIE
ncbi:MAG: glycosyltransferase family 2 protein [Iphinoe sp. HA4291-MV1]|jgi:glycosyltransferase involved in cell wall biosynthesis|nr:glycosyltransferase family 2 protein [Iphinoe sp. HA4291-MV1]